MPTAESLNCKGNEGNTLSPALLETARHLPRESRVQSEIVIEGGPIDEVLLKGRDYSYVEGRITPSIPGWEEDVGRTRIGAREEATNLPGGVEASRLSRVENRVAKKVMAKDPFSKIRTANSVVAHDIAGPVAVSSGTISFGGIDGQTKAVLGGNAKFEGAHVKVESF